MIYTKIYLSALADTLVIEAAGREDGIYLSHAKQIFDRSGRLRFTEKATRVMSAENIAISPEARAFFKTLIESDDCTVSPNANDADLQAAPPLRESYGGFDPGYFAFIPTDLARPTLRTLAKNEPFTLSCDKITFMKVLDTMQTVNGGRLATLDLSVPLDGILS